MSDFIQILQIVDWKIINNLSNYYLWKFEDVNNLTYQSIITYLNIW